MSFVLVGGCFLGRRVDTAGVHVTDAHIKDVLEWPVPKCRKDVERFLGFINYHREFVQGMAGRTAVLYNLTGSRSKWEWTEDHQQAFEDLKQVMTSPPVLGFPNDKDLFVLDTDASDFAIGAELSQVQQCKERVISYASKTLNPGQRKYCTTRKELLSVLVFTRHYRHYLLCRKFMVRTDHASLAWLMRFKCSDGLICRWLQELGQYDFSIVHRSGSTLMLMDCHAIHLRGTVSAMWQARICPRCLVGDVSFVLEFILNGRGTRMT